jgi:exosortase/archaeosortase family protein
MSKKKHKPSGQHLAPTASSPVLSDRRPIWRFIAGFALLLVLFYAVYISSVFNQYFLEPYVGGQTRVAAAFLHLFGADTHASGTDLMGPGVTLTVKKGCDGMEATALYVIGILLMPFSRHSKLVGLAAGLAVLVVLNLLRIVGLYLSQVHWPAAFEWLHLHGGFALFTTVSVFMWMLWANWAMRREPRPA